MAVARDLVGISVPFAAGVAAGTILCSALSDFHSSFLSASLAAPLVGISVFAAMHLDNRHSDTKIRLTVAVMFILTGLFCAFQVPLLEGIPDAEAGPLRKIAYASVGKLRECIDSIPFKSGSTGPMVKALLTGDRSDLDKWTIEVFRASGASHILALSGLHLGVIYLILCKLTSPLGNSRRAGILKCWLIIGTSGFYSIMTGAAPSIIRAFLFIIISEMIKLKGRKRDSVRILLGALTIQLALKPDVVNSLGFQLSYLAMAGIIFIYPKIKDLYPESGLKTWDRLNPLRRVWQAAAMSISCQVFTGPLAWYRFHTFPEYFLITNFIALPMTNAIMVLSVATIALSALGACPTLLVTLNDHAVQGLVWCLQIIAGLDAA